MLRQKLETRLRWGWLIPFPSGICALRKTPQEERVTQEVLLELFDSYGGYVIPHPRLHASSAYLSCLYFYTPFTAYGRNRRRAAKEILKRL